MKNPVRNMREEMQECENWLKEKINSMNKTRLKEEKEFRLFVCEGVTVIKAENLEEAEEILERMVVSDKIPFTPNVDNIYGLTKLEDIPDGWHQLLPMTGFDINKEEAEHYSRYTVEELLMEEETQETKEEQTHKTLLERIENLEKKLAQLEKKK